MEKDLSVFEKKIGIKFNDSNLLKQVFVHRSYLNEAGNFELNHNERLEFLGDAVLELVVTENLYKTYPNPEGELTNWRSALVRGEMLAAIAGEIDMGEYLFLSRGEAKSGGRARQIILANAFEALLGAIYLDNGFDEVKKFIEKSLIIKLPEILEKQLYIDAKSKLQEVVQEKENITPIYKVLSDSGPDHSKIFNVGVFIGERMAGDGSGNSKQAAEQSAACAALEKYNII